MPISSGSISGLARTLVHRGRLPMADAETILAQAEHNGVNFVNQLVASKKMTAGEVADFASQTFGYPLIDINALDPSTLPYELIELRLIVEQGILPLSRRGGHLFVALSDPTNQEVLDKIRIMTSLIIDPIVVEDDKLQKFINRIADERDISLKNLGGQDLELAFAEETETPAIEMGSEVDDAPVVKYLQKILLDAINADVSDIHIEPYEKNLRIRYRMDGVLYEVSQPPLAIKDKIAARIKVISRLDISEKRVPQDGRMKLVLSKSRAIDFRVSTLPTLFGEKIVLRILDPASATIGIDALGYEPEHKQLLLDAIGRPDGMILVTGPTGSGKTVSLYTCLNILNGEDINISTAEDPAEINLPGINQVNVNEKAGLTFATALRAFLRQDPDVIMVGEIRDLETADIAVKAAQTGHLVLSTLHTNDAPSTLTRLINMGVAPFNIASSIHLITAQRLARRLCQCKRPVDIPANVLISAGFIEEELGSWQPYGPGGCDVCKQTGYKGRIGIYQVLPVSEEMSRIIMRSGNAHDIADQARREKILTLRQSGLRKIKLGITSLEEVLTHTNA
ncbi:MAG: type IV-A pilus assembly ATPase PilB [Proteobacteria bacterium]|nr:type IV-A pilus assembly ATPase PilB [Pseudomonadota bacterium]MDE3207843.1 type IV-A pilus assembly ATPase PilB [Pseudomonadota bacterium]